MDEELNRKNSDETNLEFQMDLKTGAYKLNDKNLPISKDSENENSDNNIWASGKIWRFLILLIFSSAGFGNNRGYEEQNDGGEMTKPN